MDAGFQAKFKPFESPASRDYSDAKVSSPNADAVDANETPKVSFKDLLLNSNDEMARAREAQKNGNGMRLAKSDAEFAEMMASKINQENLRKPQNQLDKEAFLKLFVTQMRNQDPLNPDDSAEMAAQLAQFHGLEQMMNVNKNLEKIQTDANMGRAVGLVSFVGKEVQLDNGRLNIAGGKLTSNAVVHLNAPSTKTTLEVRDGAGVVQAQAELGFMPAGDSKLEWSGRGLDGKPIADGIYTFNVLAGDSKGQSLEANVVSTVKVTGVDLHEGGGSFFTEVGKVSLNDVAAVGDNGFAKPGQLLANIAQTSTGAQATGGMEIPVDQTGIGPVQAK